MRRIWIFLIGTMLMGTLAVGSVRAQGDPGGSYSLPAPTPGNPYPPAQIPGMTGMPQMLPQSAPRQSVITQTSVQQTTVASEIPYPTAPCTNGSSCCGPMGCGAMGCGPVSRPDLPFTPFMLGDFVGPVANLFSNVKIGEGESPRPVDRVFYRYNFYNNLNKSRWTDPTESLHNVNLYQHTFGFEKTFLDQRFSLGLRIPFYTLDAEAKDVRAIPTPGGYMAIPGGDSLNITHFDNISAILKAVLWEDVPSGSVITGGATMSFPTASSKLINPGMSTLMFLQPFGGYIFNFGDFYVQGFSSITLPVASPQSIVWFNDLGVGYYLYRDYSRSRLLTAITPTVEVHVATPLRSPDPTVSVFGVTDTLKVHNGVNVTTGATLEFMNNATLGLGLVLPMTGPKPFDVELLAQLNYRF